MLSPVCKAKFVVRRSDPADPHSFPCRSASCTGPCLAPQGVGGGTGLEDMGWGLRTNATRAFIRVRYFQSEEVGEESAVPCSQPEDGGLLGSVQLVDMAGLPQVPFADVASMWS